MNNQVEYYPECRIIFSTLWSKIETENIKSVRRGMNDFSLIEFEGETLTPQQYNNLFNEDFVFLQQSVQTPYEGKTIVVTHHVPTLKNYPSEFINSPINNGFVTDLSAFIESSEIDYWIYGHHHRNISSFCIGNTKLLTNQLGYVVRNECPEFDDGNFIEV